jgi:hypothetical protein
LTILTMLYWVLKSCSTLSTFAGRPSSDPATKKKDQEEKEPDDVKRRIEATLAAAREESIKRGPIN